MKIKILSLILCLTFLLTLASCAFERHDLLHSIEIDGVTYCVRGSGTRAKQLVVKRGDDVLWAKSVKVAKAVGLQGGEFGFDAVDLNFDGAVDLMLATDVDGDRLSYVCYLYDAEKETYVKSDVLAPLYNIRTDAELKAIFGFDHTYKTEKAYADVPETYTSADVATKYVWKDGALVPEIRVSLTYFSETDMYLYSVAYYEAETGKFADDYEKEKWMTPAQRQGLDFSMIYYFK